MATQETIKQLNVGGVLRDIEDVTARGLISSLQTALDALTSGDTTTAIESFNEIVAFLENVSDSSTLQGIIAGLNTAIAAKYTKPGTGIPASDLAQAVQTILNDVANKANSADVYPKSQTYDKDEVDAKVENIGDGKSAYEIAVEGGFNGTEEEWLASLKGENGNDGQQGVQGNSGVAGADGIEVVNNTDDGGYIIEEEVGGETVTRVAVLSAEAGKQLALQTIAKSGEFWLANKKAKENPTLVFPWLLKDYDEQDNAITKMMWHVGNQVFVDAIGGIVDGERGEMVYEKIYEWEDVPHSAIESIDLTTNPRSLVLSNDIPEITGTSQNAAGFKLDNQKSSVFLQTIINATKSGTTIYSNNIGQEDSSDEAIDNTIVSAPQTLDIPLAPTEQAIEYRLDIDGYVQDSSQYTNIQYSEYSNLWPGAMNLKSSLKANEGYNTYYYGVKKKSIWFSLQAIDEDGKNTKLIIHREKGLALSNRTGYNFEYDYITEDVKTGKCNPAKQFIRMSIILGPCTIKLFKL